MCVCQLPKKRVVVMKPATDVSMSNPNRIDLWSKNIFYSEFVTDHKCIYPPLRIEINYESHKLRVA